MPQLTHFHLVTTLLCTNLCFRSDKISISQLIIYGFRRALFSLFDNKLCFILSNALEESIVKTRTASILGSSKGLVDIMLNLKCAVHWCNYCPSWTQFSFLMYCSKICLLNVSYTVHLKFLAITDETLIPRNSWVYIRVSTLDRERNHVSFLPRIRLRLNR